MNSDSFGVEQEEVRAKFTRSETTNWLQLPLSNPNLPLTLVAEGKEVAEEGKGKAKQQRKAL